MPHILKMKDGKLLTPFGIRDLLDYSDGSLHTSAVQPGILQECIQSIHLVPDIAED